MDHNSVVVVAGICQIVQAGSYPVSAKVFREVFS